MPVQEYGGYRFSKTQDFTSSGFTAKFLSTRLDFLLAQPAVSPIRKLFGYWQGLHAITAPFVLSYLSGYCCDSQIFIVG